MKRGSYRYLVHYLLQTVQMETYGAMVIDMSSLFYLGLLYYGTTFSHTLPYIHYYITQIITAK